MKTLELSFTTPEESKQLLELGVPADSADCYLIDGKTFLLPSNWHYSEYVKGNGCAYLPCWSVGRLMEIIDICALGENSDPNTEEYPSTIKVMNKLHIPYVEYLVKSMERAVQLGTIDFSKLKEDEN
jgi:hypothetical protein